MKKLTIGMATMNDFEGLWMTLQSLRMFHVNYGTPEFNDVELLVVSQSPEKSPHRAREESICERVQARYLWAPDPPGTSPSRNRVIAEAQGEFVMCVDSHVMFPFGCIKRLLQKIERGALGDDLYCGPMMYDHMHHLSTQFTRVWGSDGMLGQWGLSYMCTCGHPNAVRFSMARDEEHNVTRAVAQSDGFTPLRSCACGKEIPVLVWEGHEAVLLQQGFKWLGTNFEEPPFEVPAMGLGMFITKKAAWLGFVEHARGFGGEEFCVHDLYRQAGRKTMSLPYVPWLHRFGYTGGDRYAVRDFDRCRNYVLWFNRLGKPLEEIEAQFVPRKVSPADWRALVADPVNTVNPIATQEACNTCGAGLSPLNGAVTPKDAHDAIKAVQRDINEHMDTLRDLASQVKRVTELTIRRESSIAFMASSCEALVSYGTEWDPACRAIASMEGFDITVTRPPGDMLNLTEIPPTDLLFLNTRHTGSQITHDLELLAGGVSRWIVIHNTQIYGETGEDGQPGMLAACRAFMRKHPRWSVMKHYTHQHGLTILTCAEEDKPKLPAWNENILGRAWSFAKALVGFVAGGMKSTEEGIYNARLEVCSGCDSRVDRQCSVCTCVLEVKAAMPNSECPLGRWEK